MIARVLAKGADIAELVVSVATGALLFLILAMNTLEIVSRTFLAFSFQWIYEANLLLASWMYFLGIFLVYRRGGDITMVGLANLASASWRPVVERAIHCLTGAVFLVVAWYSWRLIELQWPFRTPGVGFPRAAFTLPLLVGTLAVSLEVVRQAFGDMPRPTAAARAAEDNP